MRGAGARPGSGPQMAEGGAEPLRQRLDLWLFHARCVRTRTSAAELVKAGRVRLNGARVTAPAQPVRRGDVLTVSLDSRVRLWRVTGFIERRGDAAAALTTYVEVTAEDGSAAPTPAPGG